MTIDTQAEFIEFASARWPRMYRLAYLLTAERATAEDVLQTTLEKTYARWPTVARLDAPEAHVRKLMVQEVVSTRRRRQGRAELLDDHVSDARLPRQDGGAVEPELLWLLVCALPQRQRVVLVLRCYEALTDSQTAEVLGWSVRRVRRQFDDARLALRLAFAEARPGEAMDG